MIFYLFENQESCIVVMYNIKYLQWFNWLETAYDIAVLGNTK